ncbi:MAG TPA: hypothetical protein GX701_04225 [Clostridiales bacterium]|nr:hypothetical protein [Clostridiales bacterium]
MSAADLRSLQEKPRFTPEEVRAVTWDYGEDDGRIYSFPPSSEHTARIDTLPNPFAMPEGGYVSNLNEWNRQRSYMQQALMHYIYGPRPSYQVVGLEKTGEQAEGDFGHTTFYKVYYGDGRRFFRIRVTKPARGGLRYPVIMRFEHVMEHRFPVEAELLSENRYVFVAVNHLDLAPNEKFEYQPSHIQPKEAKAIMAWAYGASLSMDVLERLSFVDTKRVCITGHSRTGKAAICAAAFDERFALVVPNNSGAGGASSFRTFGQPGAQGIQIALHQPSWLSDTLAEFVDKCNCLPVDMHWATALVAPRPIFFTESRDGGDSLWAGPRGTYACWSALDEIYKLYGEAAVMRNLIHTRAGQHDQLESDYRLLVSFCNFHFYKNLMILEDYRMNAEYMDAKKQHLWTAPW